MMHITGVVVIQTGFYFGKLVQDTAVSNSESVTQYKEMFNPCWDAIRSAYKLYDYEYSFADSKARLLITTDPKLA